MRSKISPLIATVLLTAMVTAATASCADNTVKSDKPVVAVSILPMQGFVEAVAGDKVEVITMVPPGAEPHTYEVTTAQMTQLSNAIMYAKVGSGIEFELAWMDKLTGINKDMTVIDCSEGITLRENTEEASDEHGSLDPHIWLSVNNARLIVRNICDGLINIDPENQSYYEANCNAYIEELDGLDAKLQADFEDITIRSFIVFHPAFGYFARDYGLEQIAVEQDGKEPDADYLARLIETAEELDIKVIFVSAQFNSNSAEFIANEIGGEVVLINPLAQDFIYNMTQIETAMKQAMQ